MAEYIYIENGKEIKREPVSRGRPKAGAVKQPNGDYIINVNHSAAPKVEKAVENVEETKKDNFHLEASEDTKLKIFQSKNKYPLDKILSCLYFSKNDKKVEENGISVFRVIVQKNPIIDGIGDQAVYNKMFFDLTDKTITVWSNPKSPPSFKVYNAIE